MMWCQPSGNESSLGMSPVWEWVQSGNESWHWYRMDPHPALVPGDCWGCQFFYFLILTCQTCLDLQCLLQPGLCCRWVVNCYHWKLVIGSYHETYLLIYTSRSSVSLHCLFAHIASFPVAYNLTCSLEMYISLHAVLPSTIRWVVHLGKSIFLPVG